MTEKHRCTRFKSIQDGFQKEIDLRARMNEEGRSDRNGARIPTLKTKMAQALNRHLAICRECQL